MFMSSRYAKLSKSWLMRGWSDIPFAVVDWTNGDLRPFNSRLAYVARACDGETDFNSLMFLPVHRTILDKLVEQGIAEECQPGDAIGEHQHFRKAPNPRLPGIHWAITGRCNLNCRHCYMEAPSQRYADISDEDIQRVLDQFERANFSQVSITGGEPFLRSDLLDIIQRLLERKIRVHQLYSNGLLITDEILEKINALGFSPDFCLSFDGMGTHDYMRGTRGTESRILDTIRRIRAFGFQVIVSTSIDRKSKDGLIKTYQRMKELDVQSWRITPPNRTGNWRSTTTHLSHAEEAAIYSPLLNRWYDDGIPFHLQLGAFFNSLTDPAGEHQPKIQIRHKPESYDCGVCRQRPYLLPDGTLLPCHGFTGTGLQDMPNLLEQDLDEIWTTSRLKEVIDTRKSELLKHNEECVDCDLFEECGMGCRARAFIEAGDITAKDPLTCEMMKGDYRKRVLESLTEGKQSASEEMCSALLDRTAVFKQ